MVQVSDVAASKNGRHPSNLRIEKIMPHPDRFIVCLVYLPINLPQLVGGFNPSEKYWSN